jgi:chorismate mutase
VADEPEHYIVGDAVVDAVEQPAKRRWLRRKKKSRRGNITHCENCGTALAGPWCSACGQHAIDYRRSLWRVAVDAADAFFDWDTKFLRTARALLLRPWRLTNEFNAGHRVRYAHPLRLYLLASIAFFLLARLGNFANEGRDTVQVTGQDRAELAETITRLTAPESTLSVEQRARVEALLQRLRTPEAGADPLERQRAARAVLRLSRLARKRTLTPNDAIKIDAVLTRIDEALAAPSPAPSPPDDAETAPAEPGAAPAAPTPPRRKREGFVVFSPDDPNRPRTPFESWVEERVKEKIGEDGTRLQLFISTLRDNIPTMMLFCIPLFALVLKLLYIRQRRFYIEHLVYAVHVHSFVYVATIVISLFAMAGERWLPVYEPFVVLLSFAVVVQVFLSIRYVYQQGWFFTTFKFLLGGLIYLFVLAIALGVTAIVTFLLP